MGLSCSCAEYDGDGWFYHYPQDFTDMPAVKRRRKCCSCGAQIVGGDTVAMFHRARAPQHEIEENIHGDEVPLAPYVMCEECGGLFFSLTDLGYCVDINDDMRGLVKEYSEIKAEEAARKAHQIWLAAEIKLTGCIDSPVTDPIRLLRHNGDFW